MEVLAKVVALEELPLTRSAPTAAVELYIERGSSRRGGQQEKQLYMSQERSDVMCAETDGDELFRGIAFS